MKDYIHELILKTKSNHYFRQVLETGESMQLVIMNLKPGEEIGSEVHQNNEQLLICLSGDGKVVINGIEDNYLSGDMVLVKAGQEHNFINTGSEDMKIITIYSPPHHADGTIHKTKSDADLQELNLAKHLS